MPGPRMLVRFLVGAAFIFALVAGTVFPVPADPPAVALEQASIYRLEVALAAFYGLLLLATPAYSGMVMGRLPTEISTRGAKFASEAEHAVERDEATIRRLERGIAELRIGLSKAQAKIDLPKGTQVTKHDEK